jgi:amino acid transporter
LEYDRVAVIGYIRPLLGIGSLLALGINGIIGVGIFFIPVDVAALVPGASGATVYIATAVVLLPVAFVYAVLGGRFAQDGGPYIWALAAFGPELAFAVGWTAYVSAVFSSAAVIAGFSEAIARALGTPTVATARAVAIVCIATLATVAASGLRPSAFAWSLLTIVKLIPLVILVGLGAAGFLAPPSPTWPGDAGSDAFLRAMLIVVFALQGFEIVAVPAGHVRSGGWAIPVATTASLIAAALLYALLHLVCSLAVPDLSQTPEPLVAAAHALGGPTAGLLVAIGTSVSALGIAFGMLVMTPRYLAALGGDEALGSGVGDEDSRGVPRRALAITCVLITLLVLIAQGSGTGTGLRHLFVLSSVLVLTQYSVSVAALAGLGWRRWAGLDRRAIWLALCALVPIIAMAQAVTIGEFAVGLGVLVCGGGVILAHRLWMRMAGFGS